MGNWRTVHVRGTCNADEVEALNERLTYDYTDTESFKTFCCLSFSKTSPGLAGLGDWPAEKINRIGNLAERDYTPDDVATILRELVTIAPSLRLQVDCGSDYEDLTCVSTILVHDGVVEGPINPMVVTLPSIPDDQVELNLLRNLIRKT